MTNRVDGGITVGRSQRVYIFGREEAPVALPLSAVGSRPGSDAGLRSAADDAAVDWGTDPLAWVTRTDGLSFDLNLRRLGFAVGSRSRAMLRLPVDESRVVFLELDGREDFPRGVLIGKEVRRPVAVRPERGSVVRARRDAPGPTRRTSRFPTGAGSRNRR